MNQLKNAHSPYLLQHAENPVYWKFWNQSNLEIAQKENKLLLISIGYSACHWCHVMEHECFEDLEVAKVMNKHFISIKIDREEQPEVDAIYMKALQLMTKHGGWPLNIVALPDGRPVWGATYVNKNEWISVLNQLADLHKNNPEKMVAYAENLLNGIKIISDTNELPKNETKFNLKELVKKWSKSFDLEYGGYVRTPKFMMPSNLDFLQTYAFINKEQSILNYIDTTLTRMAWGGLFDTIHGGFSRYSVDEKWHIPHFEKMLYDNALLLKVYSDAFKRTKNKIYLEVIEKTVSFLLEDFLDPSGGFYSALDADSHDNNNQLIEGAYYSWKIEELKKIISDDFDLFTAVYNINSYGHWEEELYVLIQNKELDEISNIFHLPVELLIEKKQIWESKLKKYRSQRIKPRLDDKILTSWNAMLLSGLIHANSLLKDVNIEKTIYELEAFIANKLTSENYILGHAYKKNDIYIAGLLEDYAFVIQAYIDMYSFTLNELFLFKARDYTNVAFDLFYNSKKNFFCSHIKNQNLIVDQFEIEDNVIPSSNAIMANNLIILSKVFENSYYEKTSETMVNQIIESIDYGSAFSHWLLAYLKTEKSFREITIIGSKAPEYLNDLQQIYLPNHIISGFSQTTNLPFLKNYTIHKETEIYVCFDKECLPPFIKVEDYKLFHNTLKI